MTTPYTPENASLLLSGSFNVSPSATFFQAPKEWLIPRDFKKAIFFPREDLENE